MREHDVDGDGPVGAPSHRDDHREAASGREIGHSIEARRPDALGSDALLQLQQAAGNSGVNALIAQRSALVADPDHANDEAGADESAGEGRSPVADVVATQGSPLDADVRASMEASLGRDFGDVRVHGDAQAARSARSVQAQAYTVGDHVVFGEGRYQPASAEGRRTLAHELTHVVQQREGPVDGTPQAGGIRVSDPGDRFEQEAESVADRVMATPAAEPTSAVASALQRQEEHQAPEDALVQRQAEEEVEEEPGAGTGTTEAAPASEAGTEAAPAPEAGTEPAPPAEGAPTVAEEEEESVTGG